MKNTWQDFDDIIGMNKKGGRGTCPFCKEQHENVAYHREHDCTKNPNSTTNVKLAHLILNEAKSNEAKSKPLMRDILNEYTQGLRINCDVCGMIITTPGALLFSPPKENSTVTKFHICTLCYKEVMDFIMSKI